jgi:hypothetical protein
MRKIILFVLSVALVLGGFYVVVFELLVSSAIYFRLFFVGAILILLGGYLLWTDFLAPRLGVRTWED